MSLPIARPFGIRLGVDLSWLAVIALFPWPLVGSYLPARFPDLALEARVVLAVAAVLLFFVSIAAHELAHALAARRLGNDVESITLFFYGGVAVLKQAISSPSAEVRIALAGPAASGALALLFWGLGHGLAPSLAVPAMLMQYLALTNAALALFNLVPGHPLDGSRLLHAGLWRMTGEPNRAQDATYMLSRGLAYALLIGGFGVVVIGGGAVGVLLSLLGWSLLGSTGRGRRDQPREGKDANVRRRD